MILGLLRVKNEARWIRRSIESILPACERILVMDDHSDDETPHICAEIPGVTVFDSPYKDMNETRDKNLLLQKGREMAPEWILHIDGDEMLATGGAECLTKAAADRSIQAYSMQVLYLWDSEDIVRLDGIYSRFWRASMFRPQGHDFVEVPGANFGIHCGNVPNAQQRQAHRLPGAPLLHFGYMHKADRIRKFRFYNRIDGKNPNEDGYRHMVIGDLFPAQSKFRHGGPLVVRPLEEYRAA